MTACFLSSGRTPMTDTPMTSERLAFFQPGHLYAARVGWPEGRERFRFLCESVTTEAETGQKVAHGHHGRLRTADGQWIWTPNPRTYEDWRGGAWADITDWASLLAEVDRLRAEQAENEGVIRALRRHRDTAEKEVAQLRKALSDAADQVAERDDELGKASAHSHFLERNTLPELRREIERHQDGKARWRGRAEVAEARLAELESATGTARAMHRKHSDSEHCQADDMTWPCPTVTALGGAL